MSELSVIVTFQDGDCERVTFHGVPDRGELPEIVDQLEAMTHRHSGPEIASIVIPEMDIRLVIEREWGWAAPAAVSVQKSAPASLAGREWPVYEMQPAEHRVQRCRSALEAACRIVPSSIRADALDEWIDELECAAAARRPVVGRTISIVLRGVPALALRARRPLRGRPSGPRDNGIES